MSKRKVFAGAGGFLALMALSAMAFVGAAEISVRDASAIEEPFFDRAKASPESVGSVASKPGQAAGMNSPSPAQLESFEATAYCDFGITYSGILARRGMVAADPEILPIGSVIEVQAGNYSGIYTVMDTGAVVKGRVIDIFVSDYEEAIQFGRQKVKVRVLRRGWHPDAAPEFRYTLAG